MQDINTQAANEAEMTEVIFDACRGNVDRSARLVNRYGQQFRVSFVLNADGTHQAAVRDAEGVVIALANVDEFDC